MELEFVGSTSGGQLLRIVAPIVGIIHATTGQQFKITITDFRKGLGLGKQHLAGFSAVCDACGICAIDNDTKGPVSVGTKNIYFETQSMPQITTEITCDVKSAGSCTLVIQTLLPTLLFLSQSSTKLKIIGGTDVDMSPPIYEMISGLFHTVLPSFGIPKIDVLQVKRCWNHAQFSKFGGLGEVVLNVPHMELSQLNPINSTWNGISKMIFNVHCPSLKYHDTLNELINKLKTYPFGNIPFELTTSKDNYNGNEPIIISVTFVSIEGCHCTTHRVTDNIDKIIDEIRKFGDNIVVPFDDHLQDQILLFMALANGPSCINVRLDGVNHANAYDHLYNAINVYNVFGNKMKGIKMFDVVHLHDSIYKVTCTGTLAERTV